MRSSSGAAAPYRWRARRRTDHRPASSSPTAKSALLRWDAAGTPTRGAQVPLLQNWLPHCESAPHDCPSDNPEGVSVGVMLGVAVGVAVGVTVGVAVGVTVGVGASQVTRP